MPLSQADTAGVGSLRCYAGNLGSLGYLDYLEGYSTILSDLRECFFAPYFFSLRAWRFSSDGTPFF